MAAGAEAVVGCAPFDVSLQGLGVFPGPTRPRVVWVGVTTGAAQLIALHDLLEPGLLARRLLVARPFSAHVTLGRVRQDVTPASTDTHRACRYVCSPTHLRALHGHSTGVGRKRARTRWFALSLDCVLPFYAGRRYVPIGQPYIWIGSDV